MIQGPRLIYLSNYTLLLQPFPFLTEEIPDRLQVLPYGLKVANHVEIRVLEYLDDQPRKGQAVDLAKGCLLYTSPSPRD